MRNNKQGKLDDAKIYGDLIVQLRANESSEESKFKAIEVDLARSRSTLARHRHNVRVPAMMTHLAGGAVLTLCCLVAGRRKTVG